MSSQDFINLIQNKQLENTLKLAKNNIIKIGGKEYKKKPLSAKQWREIVQLNQKMTDAKGELARTDILLEMREKGALYYFNIPASVFDEHYETIGATIEGHILRSNMGANSDIDFAELLKRFEDFNNYSNGKVTDKAEEPIKQFVEEKRNKRRHKKDASNA
jgi:hypothetical protein